MNEKGRYIEGTRMWRTEDNGSVKVDKERRTETEQESMQVIRGVKGNAAEGSVRWSKRAEGKGRPVEKETEAGKGRGEMKESLGKLREKDRIGRNRRRPG